MTNQWRFFKGFKFDLILKKGGKREKSREAEPVEKPRMKDAGYSIGKGGERRMELGAQRDEEPLLWFLKRGREHRRKE